MYMKSKHSLTIAALTVIGVFVIAAAGCKMSGMAVTTRGQVLKVNIVHPKDLPERGEDNIDIVVGSRGVNSVRDVLLDVELPPQLIVLDETHERGVTMTHDPGSNVYHYTFGNLQPTETSTIRYKVRTSFGTMSQSDSMKATAWQRDLPGDQLVETAVIKLRP
jgi:hypothetical protein